MERFDEPELRSILRAVCENHSHIDLRSIEWQPGPPVQVRIPLGWMARMRTGQSYITVVFDRVATVYGVRVAVDPLLSELRDAIRHYRCGSWQPDLTLMTALVDAGETRRANRRVFEFIQRAEAAMPTTRFQFDWTDARKVGIGLLIAMAGAALTYASEWVAGTDFGVWTPTVVAAWSVIVNAARKFLSDHTPENNQ